MSRTRCGPQPSVTRATTSFPCYALSSATAVGGRSSPPFMARQKQVQTALSACSVHTAPRRRNSRPSAVPGAVHPEPAAGRSPEPHADQHPTPPRHVRGDGFAFQPSISCSVIIGAPKDKAGSAADSGMYCGYAGRRRRGRACVSIPDAFRVSWAIVGVGAAAAVQYEPKPRHAHRRFFSQLWNPSVHLILTSLTIYHI